MLKKYLLPELFVVASIICVILYNIKGQSIAPDGTLQESFGFIPLSWLFIFAAIISFIVIKLKKKK